MNRAIAHHQLRPVIDRVFPWDEARSALATTSPGGSTSARSASAHELSPASSTKGPATRSPWTGIVRVLLGISP